MGVPKRLTEKQIKFAQLVVSNEGRMNGTECAREAGYGEACRIRAYELQNPKKYPLVVKYIGELRAENQKKYDVTYGRHITELAKIRQEALKKGAWSAAVNAVASVPTSARTTTVYSTSVDMVAAAGSATVRSAV